jgi:hypothetical protein
MWTNFAFALSLLAVPFTVQGFPHSSVTGGVDAIISSLTTITNELTTLNKTLNGFNGGLLGTFTALQIQGQSTTVVNDINKATAVVKATSQMNDTDSLSVATAVTELQPFIYTVLDNLVAHHSVFEKAILGILSATFLVESDLKSQKSSTDALGAAITTKLATDLQSVAPLIIQDIDSHFAQAIAVYAT